MAESAPRSITQGGAHPADGRPATTEADRTVDAVARLLEAGTIAVVGLVAVGSALAVAAGRRPIAEHGPAFDPARIAQDVAALRPEGLLWAGLLLGVTLPAARVALALVAFLRGEERRYAAIAAGVLAVLAVSVVVAVAGARP